MGWLDALFGSKKPKSSSRVDTPRDLVYLTSEAKFAAVEKVIAERVAAKSASVILVGHSQGTLDELQRIADATDHETMAILGSGLSADVAASLAFSENATIDFIVAERHAIIAGDDRVIGFAEALPCRARVAHVLSLDDGLLQLFAGDNMKSMMRKLGMKEEEAIESGLVTKRIHAAQKKITKRLKNQYDSEGPNRLSFLQWFEKMVEEEGFDPYTST